MALNGGTLNMNNFNFSFANLSSTTTGGVIVNVSSSGYSTLTVGTDNSSTTFGGTLVGNALALSKVGSGQLTLSGANTYILGTTVNLGTLVIANTAGSATGPGAVTLNGGELASAPGNVGAISGYVSAGSGANTISPGGDGTIGTMTLGGLLELNSLSTLRFDISSTSSLDQINLSSGSLAFFGSGAASLLVPPNLSNGIYNLINFGQLANFNAGNFSLGLIGSGGSAPPGYQLLLAAHEVELDVGPSPEYTLSASAAGHTLIVGGSTGVTVTIGNSVISASNTTISYSGLTATATPPGSISGSPTSGTLAYGTSASNTGLGFSSSAAGSYTLTPSVSASANGTNPVLASAATDVVTVLNHSNPVLGVAGGNNQTVIVGASGVTAGLTLGNLGSNLSPLDVNSLSPGLGGSSGTAVVASGGTAAYTATLSAGSLGLGQSQSFSLSAGDQQALPGANPLSILSQTVTLNVLGHSNAALSVVSGNNQTVIVGAGGVTAGLSLSNAGTNIAPLDVNGLSAGLSGSSGTAVVASGGTAAYTAALKAGTIGLSQSQSFSLDAGDQQALPGANPLSNLSQTVTLNVLDHAAGTATVAGGSGLLVHVRETGVTATIVLSNLAGTRSDLQVAAAPTISSGSLGVGPAAPYFISPGGSQSYTAAFGAVSTAGSFSSVVTFSQAGDRQSLLGANPLQPITATINGSVFSGNAIWTGVADSSWNTFANFNDLDAPGVHAAPGVFAGFNDTLVLNDSASNRTLNLNSATPYLSSLSIGTSSGSGYALSQGTGGVLVLDNGANPASISVTSGQQTISAPVSLASPVNVTFSGAAAGLTLAGDVTEAAPGQSLTIAGAGQLTISGVSTYTGGTTVSQGTLNVAGAMLGGTVLLNGGATLAGSGTVQSSITGYAGSTIQATGNLALGDSSSYAGFNHAGTLAVGGNNVTLNSAAFANLGTLTTISGGTLCAPNGISLGTGCSLSGSGIVNAAVAAGYGSTINATGNLTLGDVNSYDGFVSDGRLYTNANTVTLNSGAAANNQNAVLPGSLTEIDGGGLVAPNGILLESGYSLVTTDSGGTVSGGTASRFLNLGNVQGPSSSSANWLTFNMLFKGGTGQTSGRIAFLGGFATGDSPGVNTQHGTAELGGSGTEFDIGGTTPGDTDNNYGQLNIVTNPSDLNDLGDLTLLPGTSFNIVDWNGFVPAAGETFTVLTWAGTLTGTASLNVDPAFAAEGIQFLPEWSSNSLALVAVPEPSGLALLGAALLAIAAARLNTRTRRPSAMTKNERTKSR
jgi:fibronectin-binding autotransporter adhesin